VFYILKSNKLKHTSLMALILLVKLFSILFSECDDIKWHFSYTREIIVNVYLYNKMQIFYFE